MATQTLVMDAVEQLGLRVTLGDIASSTGLALHEAKQELLNLAQKAEGHLQVSRQGEITYVFPPDFRSILKRKEQQDRLAALRRKLWGGFLYGLRISFGILLVVSIVLIVLALIALQMASSREQDNRSRSRGIGFYYFPNLWIGNPFWDPYPYYGSYSGRTRPRQPQKSELNFLEAVYSFLFGDGDPNANLEEERYALIGQLIRANGGGDRSGTGVALSGCGAGIPGLGIRRLHAAHFAQVRRSAGGQRGRGHCLPLSGTAGGRLRAQARIQ